MDAWVRHGGRLSAARAQFGGAAEDWIDLSTGINPNAWPGAEAIRVDWYPLPDAGALAALEAAAADHFGAQPEHVCAVPGSEIALRLLGQVLGTAPAHIAPAYGTYAETFPHIPAIGWNDLDEAARAGRSILLANPNNPDGRTLPAERLLEIARPLTPHCGWLVVDEAFADVEPSISVAPQVSADMRLVVLRSFGKFFGLAGLRLGFVVGPPAVIAAYRRLLGDWPVSTGAIAIGIAAYRDRQWIDTMRARLVADAAALDAMLVRHGYAPAGSCPLFRLIETGSARSLFERLAQRSILTRPFAQHPGWLRLGLPADAAAFDRLDQALGDG